MILLFKIHFNANIFLELQKAVIIIRLEISIETSPLIENSSKTIEA